ncbi:hypothetical protein FSARC_11164 [Fusarium sarcochroum]|uniref:NACHT domain-containing protein n=1 Tax=Fusarium sarcochroum TaxID=1208366 RepID=A0A8H4TH25_9HYPO|nr:hypothetical protein FSARC_11164 [Fusarium sarcochroum]
MTQPNTNSVTNEVNIVGNRAGPLSIQANIATLPPSEKRNGIREELLAKIGAPNLEPIPCPGTCRWILNEEQFQSWCTSSSRHLLWISGGPGKGKSHLAAYVGEHLLRKSAESTSSPFILRYSCDNTDIRRSTSLAVHLNFLHQILSFLESDVALHDNASSILRDVHTRFDSKLPRADLWGIVKQFFNREVEETDHPIYLILDGLDECDPESIEDLSKKLQQLCSTDIRRGRRHFKAIVLSRPLDDMPSLGISIDLDDDQMYGQQILHEIGLFIEVEMIEILKKRRPALDALKTILSERSNKTFLWVALALKRLKSHRKDLEDIVEGRTRDALDRLLPVGLSSMYSRILLEALQGKYDGRGNLDPESCVKIIHYICVAFEPLTQTELQTAVDIPSISTVINCCRHILAQGRRRDQGVTGDNLGSSTENSTGEKTFRPVHLSLKQYLQRQSRLTIPRPLGLLLWPSLSLLVDCLRNWTHKFFYLDQILLAALVLSFVETFKRHPVIGFVPLIICACGLHKSWRQNYSRVLQTLAEVFGSLLDHCIFSIFSASEQASHGELFLRSVTFLMDKTTGLKQEKDSNLFRPGALSSQKPRSVDSELDPFGNYACRFWADHLYSLWNRDRGTLVEMPYRCHVLQFLESNLLHWLRNLSLQNGLRDGIVSIKRLARALEDRHDEPHDLELFVKDAERLMMHFAPIIERAPFQVYAAALVFCPTNSIGRSTLWHQVLPFAKNIKAIEDNWNPLIQALEGHGSEIRSVAFSNDGKSIASADQIGIVRLWDVETGSLKNILERVNKGSFGKSLVTFSRHGHVIASGYLRRDGHTYTVMQIWDGQTGELVKIIEADCLRIGAIACSPNTDLLAISNQGGSIQIWDHGTGRLKREIPDVDSLNITSMAFSPDGKLVAVSHYHVEIRDVSTGRLEHAITVEQVFSFVVSVPRVRLARIDSLAFSPDSPARNNDAVVQLWDAETGGPSPTLAHHTARGQTVALSPNCKILAWGGRDHTIRLYDSASVSLLTEQNLADKPGHVASLVSSSDGKILVACPTTYSGKLKLWTMENDAFLPLNGPQFNTKAFAFAFCQKNDLLAFALGDSKSTNHVVVLWNVKESKETHVLTGHEGTVFEGDFSPDGKTLIAISNDCVHVWDTSTGALRKAMRSFQKDDRVFAFSHDSKFVAFTTSTEEGEDHAIEVWNCITGSFYKRLSGQTDVIVAISFSSNGERLASASWDRSIHVYYTKTGRTCARLTSPLVDTVKSLTFSIDGSILILSQDNGMLQVWDFTDRIKGLFNFSRGFFRLTASECGNYVATERGLIALNANASRFESYVDGEWLVRDGERVLWLPPDMRAEHAIFADNKLILAYCS